jgi:hypothetical protein
MSRFVSGIRQVEFQEPNRTTLPSTPEESFEQDHSASHVGLCRDLPLPLDNIAKQVD